MQLVEQFGRENLVVVLGATSTDIIEIVGTTVTLGDPSYAGPLAGVALSLPVYHILEPEIHGAIPAGVQAAQLGMFELIADRDGIRDSMRLLRERTGAADGPRKAGAGT